MKTVASEQDRCSGAQKGVCLESPLSLTLALNLTLTLTLNLTLTLSLTLTLTLALTDADSCGTNWTNSTNYNDYIITLITQFTKNQRITLNTINDNKSTLGLQQIDTA